MDGSLLLNAAPWKETLPSLRRLRALLLARGYLNTARLPHPGGLEDLPLDGGNLLAFARGEHNLFQYSAMPGLYRAFLRAGNRPAVELHEFFQVGESRSRRRVDALLGIKLVGELVEAGLLEERDGELRSRVMITPFLDKLYLSDPVWLQDHEEFVYMGRTSFAVPELVLATKGGNGKGRRGRLLDVGCGCGILGVAVADRFDEVVGTDIVDRCMLFAKLTAAVNDVENCSFHHSDVYSDVDGTFDAIVTNPPCVWVDEDQEEAKVFAAGGADWGTELPARILSGAFERLNPGGVVHAAMTCPVIRGRPYVLDVMERVYATSGADIVIHPVIEEYQYQSARSLRQAGISAMVRYLAVIRPAPGLSIRIERRDWARMLGYKVRATLPRLVAAVTGGPRHRSIPT
jgi:SAM-dependent methyltransferase